MGSRGRSIRLRIYFLVAIPLVTMLGLFSYAAYTSITNWRNLDRAPNLIRATSEPLTAFVTRVQNERRAAVVYLSQPTAASLAAYRSAVAATTHGEISLAATVHSPATTGNATPAETAAINAMVADVTGMTGLRDSVTARHLSALSAFASYTRIITAQDAVFQAEAASMTDTVAFSQGLGLIATVSAREDLSEQDALLAGALAAGTFPAPERVAFSQAAGRQRGDTLLYQSLLSTGQLKIFNATMSARAPMAMQNYLTRIQEGVAAGQALPALEQQGLSAGSWQRLTRTWQRANYAAGTNAATATLAVDEQLAGDARKSVWETAAAGAAGLILTLIVTVLLGQSVNRRLTMLHRSALTLATEQLPSVVSRLRRGESVDVAAEAPPLHAGGDEIGQVGQAIDAVRQTAIRSAVEEARVRQGVNDMFRNLARRSQSLLQRQLAVLDDMERRATDPDLLEDLFKMDHLTTRMRRHAEGLIILSGAAPGRSWSAPVKLIDVMRGAVAEVEDYARVMVSTSSPAALAGSAVTDVIHLLAELIENATTLSPPHTQVRMSGEQVGNGFAIEIEDRGLGMTPQRLAELNERLANPPEVNPASTEQLGLFVVGQLARRHGISVTLRPSPYGGTTAVALIPAALIVAEGPAAMTAAGSPGTGAGSSAGWAATGNYGADAWGYAATAAQYGSQGANGSLAGGSGAVPLPATPAAGNDWSAMNGNGWPSPGRADLPGRRTGPGSTGPGPAVSPAPVAPPIPPAPVIPVVPAAPVIPAAPAAGPAPAVRVTGALRNPGADPRSASVPGAADDGRRGRHSTAEVPTVTSMPASRPAAPPRSSFDVFTPLNRSGQDTAVAAAPGGTSYGQSGPDSGAPAQDAGYGQGDGGDGDDQLPRRVRQASLAPQLRHSAAAGAARSAGAPQASAASLTVMRNTLSALQRGWQEGRSQAQGNEQEGARGD